MLIAVLALGVLRLVAYQQPAPVRNDPLDWVSESGVAEPFLDFVRRFAGPEALLAEAHLKPQAAVAWQRDSDSSLKFQRGSAHLSARQLFPGHWPALLELASMCIFTEVGVWRGPPSAAINPGPNLEITWMDDDRRALSGPLNQALKILDPNSDLTRIAIWPEYPASSRSGSGHMLEARPYRDRIALLGNGLGNSGLRAAQEGVDQARWLLLFGCALLAVVRTENLFLALVALLPGSASLLFVEQALGVCRGTSSLASSTGHAFSELLLTLATLRLVRARSAGRCGSREALLCLGGSAALGGVLTLLAVPALRDFGANLALGIALGAGVALGLVPLACDVARHLGSAFAYRLTPREQRSRSARNPWIALTRMLITAAVLFALAFVDARWLHPLPEEWWPPETPWQRLFQSSWVPFVALFFALPALIGWSLDLLRALRAQCAARTEERQRRAPDLPASRQALIVAALLLGLAALAERQLLARALEPVYPEWLTAQTAASPVEAFELSLDPGDAPLGTSALQRLAQLGQQLDQLPGLVARIDASLATAEGVPVPSALLSRDGTLLRETLWVRTEPGRPTRVIVAELQRRLAQRTGDFRDTVVTGTWQARQGFALNSVAIVSWLLGLGLCAVFVGSARFAIGRADAIARG
jgi:hypothetical protein